MLVRTLRRHEFAESALLLFSGLERNNVVDGLNPHAVEHELRLGGRIISLPTLHAANHMRQIIRARANMAKEQEMRVPALDIMDAWGQPPDAVKEIPDLVAAHGAVAWMAASIVWASMSGPTISWPSSPPWA